MIQHNLTVSCNAHSFACFNFYITTSMCIVITSRTSFWNTNLLEAEVEDFLQETGSQGDADPDQRQDLATTIVGIIINQFPQPEAIVKLSMPWLPALRR